MRTKAVLYSFLVIGMAHPGALAQESAVVNAQGGGCPPGGSGSPPFDFPLWDSLLATTSDPYCGCTEAAGADALATPGLVFADGFYDTFFGADCDQDGDLENGWGCALYSGTFVLRADPNSPVGPSDCVTLSFPIRAGASAAASNGGAGASWIALAPGSQSQGEVSAGAPGPPEDQTGIDQRIEAVCIYPNDPFGIYMRVGAAAVSGSPPPCEGAGGKANAAVFCRIHLRGVLVNSNFQRGGAGQRGSQLVPLEDLGLRLEIVSDSVDCIPSIADFDVDCDVDLDDFSFFAGCYTGTANPVAPECIQADLDLDRDVDLDDFSIFAGEYTGSQ